MPGPKLPPKFSWPRAYLLRIYATAIKHGNFLIRLRKDGDDPQPDEAERAYSLRMALYRLRKRSDKANAVFIPPEYHLVTVGHFDEATGTLPIIYADRDMPEFLTLNGTPLQAAKVDAVDEPAEDEASLEAEGEIDLDALIASMRQQGATR